MFLDNGVWYTYAHELKIKNFSRHGVYDGKLRRYFQVGADTKKNEHNENGM